VPDVSADADPQTGYTVRVDGNEGVFGGTSAVAPLWAVDYAHQRRQGRQGWSINPQLSRAQNPRHHQGNDGSFFPATGGRRTGPGVQTVSGARALTLRRDFVNSSKPGDGRRRPLRQSERGEGLPRVNYRIGIGPTGSTYVRAGPGR
jgi:hypothetical protein